MAFVRAIGLKLGDVQRLSIAGANGHLIADHAEKPLDRNKAQVVLFGGRTRPSRGWPAGIYRATYRVIRDGQILLERSFKISF